MTAGRMHVATQWQLIGGGSVLRCKCGEWESDPAQAVREQRASHRAHRAQMGETLARLKPTFAEQSAHVRALHVPVVRGAWTICDACSPKRGDGPARYYLVPFPCDTVRALDGELGEAS